MASPQAAFAIGSFGTALLARSLRHLNPGAVTVEQVRFIGATLRTDFLLERIAGEAWAHLEVGQGLTDFTGAIWHRGDPDGLFTTSESARRHTEHRAFIEAEPEQAERSGLTPVVITHQAPNPRCIRPWFEKSRLNAGSRRTSIR